MALKALLASQAEVDALPEPIRALYVETNGKWILDVDDVTAHPKAAELNTRLAEFRDSNRALNARTADYDVVKADREALRAKIDEFKDIDPVEARRLKAEFDKLPKGKDGGAPSDVAAQLKALSDQVQRLTQANELERAERLKAQQQIDQTRLRDAIASVAPKKGVKPSLVEFVVSKAGDVFKVDGTEVRARDGHFSVENSANPLSVEEWIGSLSKPYPDLFEPTNGSGAPHRVGAGGRPNVRQLINPTPEEKGRHMDDIASGKVVVVQQ